jgi:hypothetical protein
MKTMFAASVLVALAVVAGCTAPAAKVNPLQDPDFVPICVNVQSLTNAKIYRDAGINVYVGIDDITPKPEKDFQFKAEAATLDKLTALGMYTMVEQHVWGHLKDHPAVIAWLSPVDEPDNIQDGGQSIPLDVFLAEAKKIKDFDSSHPYTVCFGQGLVNDLFKGRGIDRSLYPKYMAAVDFIQYDVYPITNTRQPEPEKKLEMVGQGISFIRQWTGNQKPAMCWIETNHIKDPNRAPTPAQTNCEVWITMVHGARGVGYFCHDFTLPEKKASALSRDQAMLAQLTKTNAKLKRLARIISAPLASEPVTLKSDGGKVIASTKNVTVGQLMAARTLFVPTVLAVNVYGEKAKAVVPFPGLTKGRIVNVVDENRTITLDRDGEFDDEFAPYQEHVYEMAPVRDPPLHRAAR